MNANGPAAPLPLPELRVRSTGEILEASVRIWRPNIKRLAVIVAALMAPFAFLGALLLKVTRPTIFDEIQRVQELKVQGTPATLHITTRMALIAVADVALTSMGTVLVIAAMTVVVMSLYTPNSRGTRSEEKPVNVVRSVLRRTPGLYATHGAAVAVALLVGLAITVPLGVVGELAGIPVVTFSAGLIGAFGLWLTYLVLHCAVPAIMAEGSGPVATLKRSYSLGRKRRRSILSASVMLLFATSIPNQLVTEMVRSALVALGGDNGAFEFIWLDVARTVAAALCIPVAAIGVVFIYLNLRLRAGETINAPPAPLPPAAPPAGNLPYRRVRAGATAPSATVYVL